MSKDKQEAFETFDFDTQPIRGFPELRWAGKRPFRSTQYFPAQKKESYGDPVDGWMNKIFWGDNLQVMSHMLRDYRGKVDLVYIDPPFDSGADYKRSISLKGTNANSDRLAFEEKQYSDIWDNDGFSQFIYERLIILKELLSDKGSIFVHVDPKRSHHVKCMMDEVFGPNCFVNEIAWCYHGPGSPGMKQFNRKHDTIHWYSKSPNGKTFNADKVRVEHNTKTSDNFKTGLRGSGFIGDNYEIPKGKIPEDWWVMAVAARFPKDGVKRTGYPTEKPVALIERIIEAASSPGDIVFDAFMGSGTTQYVAMKAGRRFLGADINLGAVETTIRRLSSAAKEMAKEEYSFFNSFDGKSYRPFLGLELLNVNDYDIFRNPVEAKELVSEAMELQPLPSGHVFDGQRDQYLVKIMPVNRIATRQDLNEIITGLDFKAFERRLAEAPSKPVERIHLVCMGHEPDLAAELKKEAKPYEIDVIITDLIRDKSELHFKRGSDAKLEINNGKLSIAGFYPMNLLQKLSLQTGELEDWKQLVESVKVDFNYDGAVLTPSIVDNPDKENLITGTYDIPEDAGTIRVKITDLLSESWEGEIENG